MSAVVIIMGSVSMTAPKADETGLKMCQMLVADTLAGSADIDYN